MGKWAKDSKTNVTHMNGGDFCSNEKSTVITDQSAGAGRIEFVGTDGSTTVLKEKVVLDKGDVVDATAMSCKALRQFIKESKDRAKSEGIFVVLAYESHNDEGLRSHHLWSRRFRGICGCF